METVVSSDDTRIAFEVTGSGPPLIIVDAGLCYRGAGPSRALAAVLAERFTVYAYDRRGRGASGDAPTYAVDREVDDLAALIEHAGGSAAVFGASSGAVLALHAARRGAPIDCLFVYEPPFIVDRSRAPFPADYVSQLNGLLAANRHGDAVKLFFKQVGLPGFLIAITPMFPNWRKLKGIAHTLVYDAAVMGDTQLGRPLDDEPWSAIEVPVLVADGGKSPAWLHTAADDLARVLPNASRSTVAGQTHMVKPKPLAPIITEFALAHSGVHSDRRSHR